MAAVVRRSPAPAADDHSQTACTGCSDYLLHTGRRGPGRIPESDALHPFICGRGEVTPSTPPPCCAAPPPPWNLRSVRAMPCARLGSCGPLQVAVTPSNLEIPDG